MGRQGVQKKSCKQSLEMLKERIKEKRAQRLSKVTPRQKRHPQHTAVSKTSLLQTLQQNNTDLAEALQAERNTLKLATDQIYQLKKENALMFWQIVVLKRGQRSEEKITLPVAPLESHTNDRSLRTRSTVDDKFDSFENKEPVDDPPEQKENSNPIFPKRKSSISTNQYNRDRPFPKRRQTDVVSYAEPSLKAKLRRGDSFTDQKFVRFPFRRKNASM